jgi:hypothetical protein
MVERGVVAYMVAKKARMTSTVEVSMRHDKYGKKKEI